MDRPDGAMIRRHAQRAADLFDQPAHQSKAMPLACGPELEARTIVADGHGRYAGIIHAAAHGDRR